MTFAAIKIGIGLGYAGRTCLRIGEEVIPLVTILEVTHPKLKKARNPNYLQAPYTNPVALWVRHWDSGAQWTHRQVFQNKRMFDWEEDEETELNEEFTNLPQFDITDTGRNRSKRRRSFSFDEQVVVKLGGMTN